MEVRLTPDQETFVRQGIESGRYMTEADAIADALHLWEQRERKRAEFLASLDEAEASIKRGEGLVLTEATARQLSEGVKRRGRERLAAEKPALR